MYNSWEKTVQFTLECVQSTFLELNTYMHCDVYSKVLFNVSYDIGEPTL